MSSAGCGKTSTLTFGMVPGESANAAAGSGNGVGHGVGGYVTITDSKAGGSRGFAMRLPDNYDKTKPYWLIFGFHWNGGNSAQVDNGGGNGYWWSYYGLQRESNNNAIFVAPDGLNAGWANSGGRDLAFADDMVKLIEDNYCVDTGHIVTSGFSYGGGMSYELACARAKVFHAAIIYEGGQLSGCDGGNDPIALWQTEGLTDTTVSMSLATPIRDRFVKNNGCTAAEPAPAARASSVLEHGRARLHELLRLFERAPASVVRPPVGSWPGSRGWDRRTSTIRARRLPRAARRPALAPGLRTTCGPG